MHPRGHVLGARSLVGRAALSISVGVLLSACGAPATKKPELGKLPSVVTTAEPEWLPFAIRAGARAPEDPREARLGELREIEGAGAVTHVAWSPDGRSLVLDNELGVAVLDLATGKVVRVSDPAEKPHHGAFAGPHGEHVVYASGSYAEAGGPHIVAVKRDGTDRQVLRVGTHPVLVGDGSRPLDALFCLSRANAGVDVLVIQSMKASPTDLAFQDATILQPFGVLSDFAIAPDRTRAAWLTVDGVLQVASLGAEGDVRSAKGLGDHGVSAPAFHPDGSSVVVATTLDDKEPQLAVVDTSTYGAHGEPLRERVTFAAGGARAPAFSADGRYIAFVSARGGASAPRLFIARWRSP